MLVLFFAFYCLYAGVFFLIVPWTRIWTLNPLLHSNLSIGLLADNPFVRGFVSGIGLLHLILCVREFARLLRQRRGSRAQ
ncbi:MAG TPA: hypothetical protein VGQ76_15520 [Thermoanaerobaculia bacterium]|nr:hypothetical protein [Thermoanaerobaculia bacterium]